MKKNGKINGKRTGKQASFEMFWKTGSIGDEVTSHGRLLQRQGIVF